MATLAEINDTLRDQNLSMEEMVVKQESTNDTLRTLASKISAQMELAAAQMELGEKTRLKDREKQIEAKEKKSVLKDALKNAPKGFKEGFGKGMALPGGGFFSKLFENAGLGTGLVLGAAGLAAAKALKTAVLGGMIAYLAPELSEKGGEKIISLFKTIGIPMEWYDNLPQGMKDSIETGIGGIAGAIVAQIVLAFTAKKGLGLLVGLGAIVTKKVFDAIANFGAAPVKPPKPPAGGGLDDAAKATAQATKAADARKLMSQADEAFVPLKPPPAKPTVGRDPKTGRFTKLTPEQRNAISSMGDQPKGKFNNVDEAIEALSKSGKAGKFGKFLNFLKGLAKIAPYAAVTMDMLEPAYAIYTDQPREIIQKEIAGALGSLSGGALGAIAGGGVVTMIPGVGQSGIANLLGVAAGGIAGSIAGEYTAESIAKFLLGGAKPERTMQSAEDQVMSMPLVAGDHSPAMMMELRNAGPTPEAELRRQGAMTAAPTPAAPAKIVPPAPISVKPKTEQIMQMDYGAATSSFAGGAPATYVNAPQSTTVNNSQSQGIVLPMAPAVDTLDGGLATGMANYLKYGYGG